VIVVKAQGRHADARGRLIEAVSVSERSIRPYRAGRHRRRTKGRC